MRWWVAVAWIEELIREAEKSVDEVEVFYVEGTSVSADLKQKKVSLATTSQDCGLGIRTIHKGRIGSSSTNDPGQWRNAWPQRLQAANWQLLSHGTACPGRKHWMPLRSRLTPSMKIEPASARDLLEQMLAGAAAHPADVTSGSAGLSATRSNPCQQQGNPLHRSQHTGSHSPLKQSREQSTGYEFDHSWSLDRGRPGHTSGERATFFARESAEGKDIPTGEYDILLSPLAYAELLGNVFVPALNGRNVHAGRSRLAQSLWQQVTDPRISMYDDPLLPGANGSIRWDAEGTPTRRIDFIKDGVL